MINFFHKNYQLKLLYEKKDKNKRINIKLKGIRILKVWSKVSEWAIQ